MSRYRIALYAAAATLLLLSSGPGARAGIPSGIALIPSQWAVRSHRTLADILGIDGRGIYLFRADQHQPSEVLAAGNTLLEWAETAPDLEAVAYGFTYPDPARIDVVPWHRVLGVAVVDETGHELLRVIGGRAAAWSPSGRQLAILLPGRTRADQDTLRIWDRRTGEIVTRRVAASGEPDWRSDDSLVIGGNTLVPSTGMFAPSQHAGPRVSPDRCYSMANYPPGPGIWLDTAKIDITESVVQVCGAKSLKRVGSALWVSGRGEGHVVALGVEEDTTALHEKSRDANLISIIDVSIPELLETIPGRLVGLASDGNDLVVLRQDGLHFVSPRSGQHASRSAMQYGSGVGRHPGNAWIEMTSIGWAHKVALDRTDTLEVRTFSVAPGYRIAVDASPYSFGRSDSTAFRVIAIRSNGSVLMESKPGLVSAGQGFVGGFAHRFIVTSGSLEVGTASEDAGEVFRLRTVTDSLARERLRDGTASRRGGSLTTMMGQPYTPKPDTTFDEPPRLLAQVAAWLPRPWGSNRSERFVDVTGVVDTSGRASHLKLAVANPPDIERAVLEAAARFTFQPARKRGTAVPTHWAFGVELKHPRSRELATPEDSASTAWISSREVGVHLRASAYYDSVDEKYRYSYALENRSKGAARVTSFTLSGCAPDAEDEFDRPEKWNAYDCGRSPGVLGWIIWERHPTEGLFGYAKEPGAWLAPMKFKSKFPPGRVRWLARVATDKNFTNGTPCYPSELDPTLDGTLSGTIVGPVASTSSGK